MSISEIIQGMLPSLAVVGAVGIFLGIYLYATLPSHPKGLAKLFFAEMWERFSFYGMRALLVLYMTKHLNWAEQSSGIYAAYGAMVYATPLIGGALADRFIGNRKAVVLGGTLMALGHFVLAIDNEIAFFTALALLIIGNGFFKPNIGNMVGKLYPAGDGRRDAGFTIFYMGVNTGAFMAPLLCGYIGEKVNWHYGFGLAGVGMVIGLLVFCLGMEGFGEVGLAKDEQLAGKAIWPISLCAFLAVLPVSALINHNSLMHDIVPVITGGGLIYMFVTAFFLEKVERERLWVLMGLFGFNVMFWTFFEQAGNAMSLYTNDSVDRHILSFEIPTSQFQSVNAFFIIAFGPVFAGLWQWLGKQNKDPNPPFKFAIALMQLGLGFFMLVIGSKMASSAGLVPVWFLLAAYFFHTTAELCLSPVGLSTVTRLAPRRMLGFTFGFWYLGISAAHFVAGLIAKMTPAGQNSEGMGAMEKLDGYTSVFGKIAMVSVAAGVVLLALSPILVKWMHTDVNEDQTDGAPSERPLGLNPSKDSSDE